MILGVRYLATQSFVISSSVTEEATHRPGQLDPDMIGAGGETRGLELGVARVEEEASAKEEDESGTLYKDPKY